MKKLMTIAAIAFGCCLIPCGGLLAQEYKAPEVTMSKETVKLDGKIYYSHIVLEKQTLYSISKAYGVTIDEIYEANRNLKETGLKKNAIILIPAKDRATFKEEESPAAKPEEKAVKEETRQKEEAAPSAKEERKEQKKGKNDYFIHIVKWYENLDEIAAKYGMTTEGLMKYNSLKDRKLTKRQKLRIPTEPQNFVPEETPQEDTEDVPQESALKEEAGTLPLTPKNDLNVVLMLPFNVPAEKHSEGIMDFYSGALIAA
ncbi:MAG: LysM peptidoglycan-binding domain-containing protein, partial [Candidatus Cryptobacteroides sp.]